MKKTSRIEIGDDTLRFAVVYVDELGVCIRQEDPWTGRKSPYIRIPWWNVDRFAEAVRSAGEEYMPLEYRPALNARDVRRD